MLLDHFSGPQSAIIQDLLYLPINHALHLLAVRLSVLDIRKRHIANLIVHTEFSHQMICQVVRLLKVIISTCCHLVEEMLFSASSS